MKFGLKQPKLDMNPVVDVAFLLLCFFMLTTTIKPFDPARVERPSSIADHKLPEENIFTVSITKDGVVLINADGTDNRRKIIGRMSRLYNLNLDEKQINNFERMTSIGVPMQGLSHYLSNNKKGSNSDNLTGIPVGESENELEDWIITARSINPMYRFVINGDKNTPYPFVARVIRTFQKLNIHKFHLSIEAE